MGYSSISSSVIGRALAKSVEFSVFIFLPGSGFSCSMAVG